MPAGPSLQRATLDLPPDQEVAAPLPLTSASKADSESSDRAALHPECPDVPPPPFDEQGLPFGPADLAFLLHGDRIDTVAMVIATVLDLARRGYVVLESLSYPPTGDAWRRQGWWRRLPDGNPKALRAYEAWLLETLFADAAHGILPMDEFYRLVPTLVPEFAGQIKARMKRYMSFSWGLGWAGTLLLLVLLVGSWGIGAAALLALEDPLTQWLSSSRWALNLILAGICLWIFAALIGVMAFWMTLEGRFRRPRDPALRRWVQWWEQVGDRQGAEFWLAQGRVKDVERARLVLDACMIYRAMSFSSLMLSGALGVWLERFGEAFPSLTLPWWRVYLSPSGGDLRWSEALAKHAASSLPVMIEAANYPAMMKDMVGSQSRLRRFYHSMEESLALGEDETPAPEARRIQELLWQTAYAGIPALHVPAETIEPPPEPEVPAGALWVWVRRLSLANALTIGGLWGLLVAGVVLAIMIFDPAPWGFVPHVPSGWHGALSWFTVYSSVSIMFHFLLPNKYEWQDAFKPKELLRSLGALVGGSLFFILILQALWVPMMERQISHALHHMELRRGAWQPVEGTAFLVEEPELSEEDDAEVLWLPLRLSSQVGLSEEELKIETDVSEETLHCLQNLPVGAQGPFQGQRTTFGLELHTLILVYGDQRCELHVPEYHLDLLPAPENRHPREP